jgi:hypothetical protein
MEERIRLIHVMISYNYMLQAVVASFFVLFQLYAMDAGADRGAK